MCPSLQHGKPLRRMSNPEPRHNLRDQPGVFPNRRRSPHFDIHAKPTWWRRRTVVAEDLLPQMIGASGEGIGAVGMSLADRKTTHGEGRDHRGHIGHHVGHGEDGGATLLVDLIRGGRLLVQITHNGSPKSNRCQQMANSARVLILTPSRNQRRYSDQHQGRENVGNRVCPGHARGGTSSRSSVPSL